jgi:hypothetical protein
MEGDARYSSFRANHDLVEFDHENVDRKTTEEYRKGIIEYIFHVL